MSKYDIDKVYGVPIEELSCPSCGNRYSGTVCENCEECNKCCMCNEPQYITAEYFIENILGYDKGVFC